MKILFFYSMLDTSFHTELLMTSPNTSSICDVAHLSYIQNANDRNESLELLCVCNIGVTPERVIQLKARNKTHDRRAHYFHSCK